MQRLFEYRLEGSGDALSLAINMDSVTAKALSRLDRYINWGEILRLTENDPKPPTPPNACIPSCSISAGSCRRR